MATVIDALLVTLGLDPSGFERGAERAERAQRRIEGRATEGAGIIDGQERKTDNLRRQRTTKAEKERLELERKQKEARDKQAKDMEVKAKQAVQGFSKMRNEALSFFAAVVGATGIKSFLENMIGTAAGLDRVSANLGMSAKDLSMWQLASERAGGSAEGMTAQLKESAAEIAKFKSMGGPTEGMTWFFRLGGDKAALKDGNTYLRARSDILAKLYKIDPTRATLMAANMGISEDSFHLLKQGSELVEQQRQAQSRLADEMAKNAPGAEDLRKKVNDLKNTFTALGMKVLPLVIPQLERFTSWLVKTAPEADGFMDGAIKKVEQFGRITGPILQMVTDGWKNIFSWVSIIGEEIKDALPQSWTDWIGEKMSKYFGDGGDSPAPAQAPAGRAPASGHVRSGAAAGTAGASALFDGLEKKHNLPAGLLDAVWAQESGRGKNMTSPVGAKGHFQFMDATAKQYGLKNPNDLNESADAAARMYADLLRQNGGNLPRALAGYNWGQGNLQRQGMNKAPAETRGYISSIMSRMGAKNAAAAANMPVGAAAAARRGGLGNASTSTSETNINGPINIVTKATDAAGIAASIGPAMSNYGLVANANAGVN